MKVYENFSLKAFNSYHVESVCNKAIFPENEEELVSIFQEYELDKITILGNGNNLILSKPYYDKVFVIFNQCFNQIQVSQNLIEAESGATLLDVSKTALNHSLSGLEFSYDIPSSVGGAIVMNAGTKEGVISDVLLKVRYLDLIDLQFKEVFKEEISLQYRNSVFQNTKNKIIVKAWFLLQHGNYENIFKTMEESKSRRWIIQPRDFPNSGSVFKRPEGKFVGPMIEQLGLKGFRIGDAQVSEKHAGFIVNLGNATGDDILNLIKHIQETVYKAFQIQLEVEQRII
ncbi:MAG: UDP-N-acetylmuramate dehydrogenase [Flavobacterium sp.]